MNSIEGIIYHLDWHISTRQITPISLIEFLTGPQIHDRYHLALSCDLLVLRRYLADRRRPADLSPSDQ